MFSPAQLLQLRQIVAEEAKEALLRHQNHRSLVIYGLPEGEATTQVHSIIAHANIPQEYISIRHRLGNPNLGRNRPLRVDLREGIPMPSMRDLARKLSDDTSLRAFHVRLLETPRQRKEGYEKRESRRQVVNQDPIATTPTKQPVCLDMSEVSSVNVIFDLQPIPAIMPSHSSIIDTIDLVSVSSSSHSSIDMKFDFCHGEHGRACYHIRNAHPVGTVPYHVYHISNCITTVPGRYRHFHGLPAEIKQAVSDMYYSYSRFRLNLD